jgi:FkbM family methyltransferase
MTPLWERLSRAGRPIVLYGTGNGADKILDQLEKLGAAAAGAFVSDGFSTDRSFRGLSVTSLAEAEARFKDMIVLLAFGTHDADVLENIKRMSSRLELYAPPFPVVGGTPSGGFARVPSERESRVRALLADDRSRFVFDSVLTYRETGSLGYLFACESGRDELWGLLSPAAGEDYLDLGAYRGDTAAEFAARAPLYGSIRAVEPDRRSFEKLSAYCAGLDRCECFRACVGAAPGEERFSGGSGRGSAASASGEAVRRESVDSLLGGKRASLIKMDVEGAEAAALDGARETLIKYSPKLLVSAYHRADNIFSVPERVLSVNPDYRVYLRHGACVPDWDVDYIFIPAHGGPISRL